MNENETEDIELIFKICTYCNKKKPLNDYNKSKNGKLGRNSRCKVCIKEINKDYTKNYYQINKLKLLKKQKEYNKNNSEKIKEYHKKYYNNKK